MTHQKSLGPRKPYSWLVVFTNGVFYKWRSYDHNCHITIGPRARPNPPNPVRWLSKRIATISDLVFPVLLAPKWSIHPSHWCHKSQKKKRPFQGSVDPPTPKTPNRFFSHDVLLVPGHSSGPCPPLLLLLPIHLTKNPSKCKIV